jgi:hypothetical protein
MIKYSFLIVILFLNLSAGFSQEDFLYRTLFQKAKTTGFICYDTLIPLQFLNDTTESGIPNMQYFDGFNYPKFDVEISENKAVLSNGTFEIIVVSKRFDKNHYLKNYKNDSNLFCTSLYFREDAYESDIPRFFPETEIDNIQLYKNEVKINSITEKAKYLYNPFLNCEEHLDGRVCGIDAYLANNGNILLAIHCGEGAAAYIVVFEFSEDGKLLMRIEDKVI